MGVKSENTFLVQPDLAQTKLDQQELCALARDAEPIARHPEDDDLQGLRLRSKRGLFLDQARPTPAGRLPMVTHGSPFQPCSVLGGTPRFVRLPETRRADDATVLRAA